MKKTIIVETALIVILAISITFAVEYWGLTSKLIDELKIFKNNFNPSNYFSYYPELNYYHNTIKHNAIYGSLSLIAAFATLAAMVLIALKDFPVFKPMLDKLTAKRADRKQAKAEKAAADKQARIERLQSELDELKKDE